MYRVVPGPFDYKTCLKYGVFKGCVANDDGPCGYGNLSHETFCNRLKNNTSGGFGNTGSSTMTSGNINGSRKFLNPSIEGSYYNSMGFLSLVGMIEQKVPLFLDYSNASVNNRKNQMYGLWYYAKNYRQRFNLFATASFDNHVNVGFHGFGNILNGQQEYKRNFKFWAVEESGAYETDDLLWRNAVHNHNTMIMFGNQSCASERNCNFYGCSPFCKKSTGALSAKMSSELDAKIDDGRPGRGKLLAYKADYARSKDKLDDAEMQRICYDKLPSQVSKAIYHNSTNMLYGCNIIKVMDDIK